MGAAPAAVPARSSGFVAGLVVCLGFVLGGVSWLCVLLAVWWSLVGASVGCPWWLPGGVRWSGRRCRRGPAGGVYVRLVPRSPGLSWWSASRRRVLRWPSLVPGAGGVGCLSPCVVGCLALRWCGRCRFRLLGLVLLRPLRCRRAVVRFGGFLVVRGCVMAVFFSRSGRGWWYVPPGDGPRVRVVAVAGCVWVRGVRGVPPCLLLPYPSRALSSGALAGAGCYVSGWAWGSAFAAAGLPVPVGALRLVLDLRRSQAGQVRALLVGLGLRWMPTGAVYARIMP